MKNIIFKYLLFVAVFSFMSNSLIAEPTPKNDENIVIASANDSNTQSSQNSYKTLKTELKGSVRNMFENLNKNFPKEDFGKLPEGLSIVEGNGFRGIKITQGLLEFRVYTWLDDTGLLDNFKKCREAGEDVIAAINGSFYSERGVLGQVIEDGTLPKVRQIPGRLSRSFVSAHRGAKNMQYWFLGETPLSSSQLLRAHKKEMVWLNGEAEGRGRCEHLLGGGGWIMRSRKDAHWEAIERQFFRFRSEDQTARKTVVAQDTNRNLYFIVFEAGFTLHQVARTFVKNDIFKDVEDVMFLDGGGSSCIVLNGKYLVPPLYLVDKARFSCIQITKPAIVW